MMELSRIETRRPASSGRNRRSTMEQARRLLREAVGDQDAARSQGADPKSAVDFDKLLRLRPTLQASSREPARPVGQSPQQDWPAALDLVRQAAEVVRQSEQRVQEQETRIQDLAQRVRDELKAAQDRADAAEARALAAENRLQTTETRVQVAESRAEARVKAAELRAQEADERAKAAEARSEAAQEWLTRIHDAIVSQLSNFPGTHKAA